MKRIAILISIFILALLALSPVIVSAEDQPLMLNDVRYWSGGEYTRVVIDLTGDASFEVNRLASPERVYFDFTGCKLTKASGQTISVEDRHVGAVRTGQYDQQTVRVVVDLKDNTGFRVFRLTGPSRVVMDIYRKESVAPVSAPASAPAPEEKAPVMTAKAPERMSPEALSKALAEATAKEPKKPEPSVPVEEPIVQTAKAEPQPVPSVQPTQTPAESQTAQLTPEPEKQVSSSQPRVIKGSVPPPLKRIVIDPGHGGKDPGAVGGGLKEKDVVLDVAKRLKRELEARGGYEVILTRSRDQYLDLEERSVLANQKDADLFISVHVNANRNASVRGIETYVLKWSDEKSSQEVAERENMVSARRMKQGRDDVGVMLASLALAHKSEQSAHLATKVQDAMESSAAKSFTPAPSNKAKGAMFYVLYGAKMPSILVELAYVTNREDSSRLKNAKYRDSMAQGIADGVDKYFKEPMPHVRVAMR